MPVELSQCEYVPEWMTRAYKNNRFVVMINDRALTTAHGHAIRAMIQRHDDTPISWQSKREIKNELFGTETTAIEYYPAESDLIDDHNIYWLWIFPEGILPKPVL